MKEKTKVYIYTRVSTAVQVDGYSLDAQKSRMKAYAEFNDFEIVGEYEDAGKSGKSIEGRLEFNRMIGSFLFPPGMTDFIQFLPAAAVIIKG